MSTTPQEATMSSENEQDEVEALRERVEELEENAIGESELMQVRNSVQRDMEHYRDNVVKPRFAELESEIERLQDELDEQRETLANITGPADGEPTKHEKRVRAVRQMMINQAEAREHGRLGWSYSDVVDNLEANGHGKVYNQQAYRIMEEADEADGFGYTTDDSGTKTLRVDLSALPANADVNNVKNGGGVQEGEQETNTAAVASND